MNYHFQELHNKEVGDDLAECGWPDDGNGRYTEHFGYGPWYYMNIVKRCHRNDFEHLVTVLPMSLVNGLIYPWTTIGLLSLYFAGRAAYSFGYQEREGAFNQLRMGGSITVNIAHLATNMLTVVIGVRMARGGL